jgi:hypothetical protein
VLTIYYNLNQGSTFTTTLQLHMRNDSPSPALHQAKVWPVGEGAKGEMGEKGRQEAEATSHFFL